MDIGGVFAVAFRFAVIDHATALGGGHADHHIQLVLFSQLGPAVHDVPIVLRRRGQACAVAHTVVVEEDAKYLVSLFQGGLGSVSRFAFGGRLGRGSLGFRVESVGRVGGGLDEEGAGDDLVWGSLLASIGEGEYVPPVCRPDDPHCLLYTSGTTGRPKGVITPHRMVAWNAYNTVVCWQLSENDVSPIFTPLYHAGGLLAFLVPIFTIGGTIVLHRGFDAEEIWRQIVANPRKQRWQPSEENIAQLKALYDAEVAQNDESFGDTLDALIPGQHAEVGRFEAVGTERPGFTGGVKYLRRGRNRFGVLLDFDR